MLGSSADVAGVKKPVVFAQMYQHSSSDTNTFKAISPKEQLQLEAAADMGALMMDGLTDGLWLMKQWGHSTRRR